MSGEVSDYSLIKISMNKFPKINSYIWLGIILLLAFIMRTHHITFPLNDMHSFRQTQTAGLIRDFYRQGIDLLYPTMITLGDPGYVILEFPLYQAISAVLYKIFIPDVILARSFSILCGILSIVFVYRLSIKFLDQKSALFASFFYAFMPLNIFFQRVPMPEPFTILLSLIMLDFMIEGINNKKNILLIIGVIAGSFGLMTKSPYVAPLYLPFIYAVYKRERSIRSLFSIRMFFSCFVPLILLVLWQSHANSVNETYFGTENYPFKELYSAVMVKLHPVNEWYFGTIAQRLDFKNYLAIWERIYREMLSFTGIFAFVLGIFSIAKRKEIFCFIWLFSILLSIMCIFHLNVVHNYYQLPLTPILAIFCGAGATCFTNLFRTKILVSSAIIILLIPFIYVNYLNSKVLFKEDNDYVEVGRFIDDHIPKNVLIVTSLPKNPDQDLWYPVLMYFADRHGLNVPHERLNEEMITYLRYNNMKYLALSNYIGLDNSINNVMCSYQIVNQNSRVIIYDITKNSKSCKKEISKD